MNLVKLSGVSEEKLIIEEKTLEIIELSGLLEEEARNLESKGIYTIIIPNSGWENGIVNTLKRVKAKFLKPVSTYNLYNSIDRKTEKKLAVVVDLFNGVPEELKTYAKKGDKTKQKLEDGKWVEI